MCVHHGSFRLSTTSFASLRLLFDLWVFYRFLAHFPFFDATLRGTINLSIPPHPFYFLIFFWGHPWYYWVVWSSFNCSDTFLLSLSLFCILYGVLCLISFLASDTAAFCFLEHLETFFPYLRLVYALRIYFVLSLHCSLLLASCFIWESFSLCSTALAFGGLFCNHSLAECSSVFAFCLRLLSVSGCLSSSLFCPHCSYSVFSGTLAFSFLCKALKTIFPLFRDFSQLFLF